MIKQTVAEFYNKPKDKKREIGHKEDGRFKKGHKINLGKKYSEERKRKISLNHNPKSNLNLIPNIRRGMTPWNKGFGTRATERHKIRQCFKYRQWRSDIFTRDNFICQGCNERGGELHAHHKKSFATILRDNNIKNLNDAELCEELWNINNGVTLCKKCHKKTNDYKGDN